MRVFYLSMDLEIILIFFIHIKIDLFSDQILYPLPIYYFKLVKIFDNIFGFIYLNKLSLLNNNIIFIF